MRWQQGRRSSNVEDRRDEAQPMQMGAGAAPLLLRVLPLLLRTRGGRLLLGIAALTLVGAHLLGIDVLSLLQGGAQSSATSAQRRAVSTEEQERTDFVAAVLGDIEDTWTAQFSALGRSYQEPHLVLFRAGVRSACGFAQSAMGPFYCPADHKIYLDLAFFDELAQRFGAPGDFAQAYVIAHEIGHHVQHLMGITDKVDAMRQRVGEAQGNALSVRLELQADCFAGVWAHHAQRARQVLEQGDVEEALNAASQIGDDNLQRRSQGTVVPESFTHGSSAQRVGWFKRGLQGGSVRECNTFDSNARL